MTGVCGDCMECPAGHRDEGRDNAKAQYDQSENDLSRDSELLHERIRPANGATEALALCHSSRVQVPHVVADWPSGKVEAKDTPSHERLLDDAIDISVGKEQAVGEQRQERDGVLLVHEELLVDHFRREEGVEAQDASRRPEDEGNNHTEARCDHIDGLCDACEHVHRLSERLWARDHRCSHTLDACNDVQDAADDMGEDRPVREEAQNEGRGSASLHDTVESSNGRSSGDGREKHPDAVLGERQHVKVCCVFLHCTLVAVLTDFSFRRSRNISRLGRR